MRTLISLMLTLTAIFQPAWVQTFPVRSVRVVVPFAPGGGADVIARLMGQRLSESWGQTVVIDNRGGAGGTVGSELVAKSAPDGYTLVMATVSTHAVAASLYRKLPYDPVRDFAPVTILASIPNYLVVHPSVPAKSVKELIALARAKPDQLTYASSGNGTSGHLSMELLKTMTGIKAVHVPFKGAGPGTIALVSGEVHMQFASVLPLKGPIESGRLRALAISGARRSPSLPDVPTVAESVTGYEAVTWYGLLAPAGTPASVISKIHSDAVKVAGMAEFRERMEKDGGTVVGNSPAEFSDYIKADIAKWAKVVKAIGAQLD
jgi:tripartite-type tricarboxylate transporter receptor subunit TctC